MYPQPMMLQGIIMLYEVCDCYNSEEVNYHIVIIEYINHMRELYKTK